MTSTSLSGESLLLVHSAKQLREWRLQPRVYRRSRHAAALAAVEHGVGEILQGFGPPDAVVIQSGPDSPAFASLSGEPAMTVV